MTRGWKIGLSILAGLCLLLILVGGGCLYVLSRYGKEFAEGAKQSQTEGESFGQNSDEAGCLKEALARNKKDGSLTKIVSINVFFGKCLEKSKQTQGFCEEVPARGNKDQAKAWAAQKCAEAGQNGLTCEAIFHLVQAHCEGVAIPDSEKPKSN